jgi:prolyl 4-hydroxylase
MSQKNPELSKWVHEQKAAGHGAAALFSSMISAGYLPEVARQVLLDEIGEAPDLPSDAMPSGGGRVPGPILADHPRCIDAGDRQVEVLMHLKHPRVVLFGDLLSREECEALIGEASCRMSTSLTVDPDTGAAVQHEARSSEGMFFQRGETDLVARIEARIARLLSWPVDHGEGLQILRYQAGGQYLPHYDYFDPSSPGTAGHVERGGQRVGTLVIYLAAPDAGGGTSFPQAGLEVMPQAGNAVFFSYDRPDPATATLHAGEPVVRGVKWIATKWLRQSPYV